MSSDQIISNPIILEELALAIQNTGSISNLRLAFVGSGACPSFSATITEQQKTFLTQSITLKNGFNPIIVLFSFGCSTAGASNYNIWYTLDGSTVILPNTNSSTNIVSNITNVINISGSSSTKTKTLTIAITTIANTLTTTPASSYSLLVFEILNSV